MSTTTSEVAPRNVARVGAPVGYARIGSNLGALGLAALPAVLTVYLSFNAGGDFAGAQGAVTAVLALIVAVRMAVVRDPFSGFSRSLRVAIAGLAVYSVWCLLSSHWSHSPARALLDFDLANLYLFALILFGSTARSHRRVHWTLILTWLAMLGVCVAALATRFRPDLFPIPLNLSPNRLAFPLTYWNSLGLFAVVGITLALHLASSSRESATMRVFATAAIPVFAVTILLTFSRSALLLGAVGLLGYALLARPRGLLSALIAAGPTSALAVVDAYHAKLIANADISAAAVQEGRHLTTTLLLACGGAALIRVPLLELDTRLAKIHISSTTRHHARQLLAAACAAAAIISILTLGGEIAHQWKNFTSQDSPIGSTDVRTRISNFSIATRVPGWKIAIQAFDRQPLDGHGAGTFPIDFEQLRKGSGVALEAHSIYLEAMSELGLVGLASIVLVIVLMVGACFMRARRSARSMWIALGVVGLLWAIHAGVDWDWEMPAVTLPVFALIATALARRGGSTRLPARSQLLLRILIGLVALVVALTGLRISVSDNYLNHSVTAFNNGDCAAAVSDARAMIGATASRPQPYAIMGYCDILDAQPQAAVNRMQAAVKRDPQNWRYYYGLSLAQAAAGRDPRTALAAAARLDPLESMILTAETAFSVRNQKHWRQAAHTLQMPVSMRE